MKPARDRPQAAVVDLGRLNDAEREVLCLLAEGHTAKSIASLTGRSVGAVNERLREARRKTGASSSRELARLVRARKSWPEEIGMASTAAAGASTRVASKGSIVMGALLITGIAAVVLWLQATPQTSSEAAPNAPPTSSQAPSTRDPLLEGMLQSTELEPSRLYRRVRTEARDTHWAAQAEAALKARYDRLSSSGRLDDLRIICASTLCEVAGSFGGKEGKDIGATMEELQGARITGPMTEIGIKNEAAVFGSRQNSDQGVFAAYWLRSA